MVSYYFTLPGQSIKSNPELFNYKKTDISTQFHLLCTVYLCSNGESIHNIITAKRYKLSYGLMFMANIYGHVRTVS